ncbi:MAG: DNA gyrase subunit A [Planctomycetota bacterium]
MALSDLPPTNPPAEEGVPPGEGSLPLDIADELRDSYLTYAMSVIVSRALPDARDGLKPSQRRILVAMNDLGLGPTSATSKCAGIVGETMKRYHPHGEQVIYPTLVRMAQDWNMRHRLVHSQGNFGSIAGLPPAAMRYTEARLTPVAAEMLEDLESETVDFIDNYDGKYREPLVLPSRFPNLLVNGSDGIAVGMATEIPPHNLAEVCDAAIRVIDEPSVGILDLMELLPGPDYPTGGIICGRGGIREGYLTGRGRVTLRARAHVHAEGRLNQIIITEVPFQQTRNRLAEQIGELVKAERIKGISAIRDESSQRGGEPVRLVIDLKRDADPETVLNQLYRFSPLERTASIILLALVDGRPRLLTIKELIECFLKHRTEVIRRRTQFLLRKAKERCHVLEGQLIAISSLDEVIRICRSSPNRQEAKRNLMDMPVSRAVLERALGAEGFAALTRELGDLPEYRMTEAQSDAVVRLQLGQLAALERDEILKEFQGLRGDITGYEALLSDERNILAVVRADLVELRERHGQPRRTEIGGDAEELEDEDFIEKEDRVVTLSRLGYIKSQSLTDYRTQNRGGRGVSGGMTRDDDFVERMFVASTHAYLLCFTNLGLVYWMRVFRVPKLSRTSQGRALANVLSLRAEEKISGILPVASLAETDGQSVVMVTRRGVVKKTPLADYSRPRNGGIIAINLDEADSLIGSAIVREGEHIMLVTRNGLAIRFDASDTRDTGRNTRGVKGIKLVGDDEVVGMVVVDPAGALLTVCANGFGKRTPFGVSNVEEEDEVPEAEVAEPASGEDGEEIPEPSTLRYRLQRRGGKGVRDIKVEGRNGPVIGIAAVKGDEDIILISASGMVNRSPIGQIRLCGRNTKGVRLINLRDGDRVASLAVVAHEEPAPATEGEAAPPAP